YAGNSIPQIEKQILYQNPHLKKIFSQSEILYTSPVTISQVSFSKKTQVDGHVIMIGDAAGMITPLCGKGMSMALHGSKIAFEQIHLFLQNKIPRWQIEEQYTNNWQNQFGKRVRTGRWIQKFFGSTAVSDMLSAFLKLFPSLT